MSKGKKLFQKSDNQVFYHQSLLKVCGQKHSCENESTKEGLEPKIAPPAWGTGEPGSPAAPRSVSSSSGNCPTNTSPAWAGSRGKS